MAVPGSTICAVRTTSGESSTIRMPGNWASIKKTLGDRKQRLLIINNFSEFAQVMAYAKLVSVGMTNHVLDILTQQTLPPGEDLQLDGYRYVWIDISGHTVEQTGLI